MKKTWTINNGWNRLNNCGQMILCEVGPRDFDPDWERHEQNAAAGVHTAPYVNKGTAYVFARKRDWEAAVEYLRANGFLG